MGDENKISSDFVPVRSGSYVLMALNAEDCPVCGKTMVVANNTWGLFPMYYKMSQSAQLDRAGFVLRSEVRRNDEFICIQCAEDGKAGFTCSLCSKEKPSNKIQKSVGDPSDYLCRDCYETVPAKVFDEKLKELIEEHRYDYE